MADQRLERGAQALATLRRALGNDLGTSGGATEDFRLGAVADLVVEPGTAAQAAELMVLAHAEKWQVTPAGAGTWTAVAADDRVSVVVSAAQLNQVHDYVPADSSASVGAGVSLLTLSALVARSRQWLPLDPPSAPRGTIGAAVALGGAGPLRLGHGSAREHVLGLQLVTSDGRILSLGGRVLKNVAGYDLTRLVTGSRGALGLVTRVNLRLRPLPEADITVAVVGAEQRACVSTAQLACTRPEAVAVEILSPSLTALVCGEPVGWAVVVRFQGELEAVAAARKALEAAIHPPGRIVEPPPSAWTRLNDAELSSVAIRLADRPSFLARTLALATELSGGLIDPCIAAHAGDGIVRLFAVGAQSEVAQWPAAIASVRQRLESSGGSLILGPARSPLLRGVPAFGALGPTRELMQGLKQKFDPGTVLSDGGLDL